MKRTTLSISFVVLLGIFGTSWYALNSQWGLDLTFNLVKHAIPGKLSIRSLQGKLLGPIKAHGINYVNNEINLTLDELQFDWQPFSLFKGTLQFTTIKAQGLSIEPDRTTDQSRSDAGEFFSLPLAIDVHEAQFSDIIILNKQQPIEISRIRLQARADDHTLQLTQLNIKSDQFDLTADGQLGLEATQAVELYTAWTARLPDLVPLQGSGKLAGSLTQLELEQSIRQPGIDVTLHGVLRDIISQLRWNLSLEITRFLPRQVSPDLPVITTQGKLNSSGELDAFNLTGDLYSNVPGQGEFQTQFEIHATPEVWKLARLNAVHNPTRARLAANGEWHPGPHLGTLSLSGNWNQLALPLTTNQQARHLISKTGQFMISGNPDNYKFETDGDLSVPNWPEMQITIEGQGNLKQVRLSNITARTLDGTITGTALASWKPQLSWQGMLQAKDLDPAVEWHDWPGRLNAEFHIQGKTSKNKVLTNQFYLKELTGTLRGYPVAAQGRVDWETDSIHINEVTLDIGDARLRASGSRDKSWNMQAALNAPDLNALCPYSRGEFTADVVLSGPRKTPHIIANIAGKKIAFQDYQIAGMSSNFDIDLQSDESFTAVLTATDLVKGGRQWQSFIFTANGTRTRHQLQLELKQEMDLVQLVINAGLNEQQIWRGEITKTVFKTDKFGDWQQPQPTSFSLGEQTAFLEPWCLTQPGARICLQGERQQKAWDMQLEANHLPLGLLENWLPAHLALNGQAELDSKLHYVPDQVLTGDLTINIPQGFRLEVPDKAQSFQFEAGKLHASLDEAGLATNIDLPANDFGELKLVLKLPDWHALSGLTATQPLSGHLNLSLVSLDQLNGFFLDSPNLTGSLIAELRLGGTIGTPLVTGESRVHQASADIPALGIKLEDINFRAYSQSGKKIDYQLSARSGKAAPLTLTGHTLLQAPAGWPTRLQIRGDNFLLANLPDAKINISPQLDIEVQGRRIDLAGTVTVPHARFRPRHLPQSTVSPSQDVVITDSTDLPETDERWKIYSNVRIILGDHVYFDGFGLQGELQGNVLLIDEPGKLTVGQGEISITEGTYRAYGQDARIRRGRLMFANTLVEDPGIDLEAVREIDNVAAGVRVRGTLKQPELTLFSEPVMSESDIISYFLLGRPIEATTEDAEGEQLQKAILAARLAGGELIVDQTGIYSYVDELSVEADRTTEQTSLVVGKYLSPKLYVRYVTGIIESSNIVEIHYKLSKHLRIQTEAGYRSSESVTGADIYYTIEY